MKKLLYLLLPLLAFASCKKDDSNEICTAGCTVIDGTVTTAGGAPVSGVKLEVHSVRDPKGLPKTRKISTAESDASGRYRMQFSLNDYEGGADAVAAVYLKYSYDEGVYLPLGEGNTDVVLSAPWLSSRPFEQKEVTLTKNIYLPKKATAVVRLEGFNPPVDYTNNFFKITAFGRAGLDGYTLALYETVADANPTVSNMPVPGDDSVLFHLEKRKPGGMVDHAEITRWVPAGGASFTFTY